MVCLDFSTASPVSPAPRPLLAAACRLARSYQTTFPTTRSADVPSAWLCGPAADAILQTRNCEGLVFSGGYEPAPTLFLLWSGSPYLSSRDAVRRRGDLHPGRGDCFVAVDRLLARTSNPTSPHSVYWLRAGTNPPLPFSTDGRAVPLCHRETPSGGVAISTPSREVTSSPLTGSLKGYRFAFPESRASRTHPTTAR
jgi:hypothetical protein